MKRYIPLLTLALAAAIAGCGARPQAAAPVAAGDAVIAADSRLLDEGSGKLAPGDAAPDFSYTLPDGTAVRLSELRGTPVVLNFWATWCLPCVEEMPELEAAFAAAAGGLKVLAVNRNELPEAIARFANERLAEESGARLTFPLIASIDGAIPDRYGVTSLPTTYFIKSDGTIGAIQIGALTPSVLAERLKAIQ